MIHILSNQETKEILSKLNEQFGIQKIPGRLIKIGKEKIFLFNGNFSEEQIKNLEKITFIERIGIYFAKLINEDVKLSLDGVQIVRDKIKKNIFEINKEQAGDWMSGKEILIETGLRGFIVLKYQNDLLGCGKASEGKITNFVPKSRRLKEKRN